MINEACLKCQVRPVGGRRVLEGFGMEQKVDLATGVAKLRANARRFAKDDEGSLVIFSLFIFVLIMMAGGMAVDLMRYESTRTNLQNTLDRAILAAADMDQVADADDVVDDYFEKAGLGLYNPSTRQLGGGETDSFSWVQSGATAHVQTYFMKNLGIPMLPAVAQATAEERVSEIEISLVLDISGSMGQSGRLGDMKDAADNFIDTIYEDAEPDTVTVSIVPYSTQVNVGQDILKNYTVNYGHNYSHCVDFEASDFNTLAVSTSAALKQTAHFDSVYSYGRPDYDRSPEFRTCNTSSMAEVTPFQDNVSTLKNAISALRDGGNTSVDVGIKWGAAMLDPAFGTVVDSLITDNVVRSVYNDRPLPYTGSNKSMKVIVAMTDGHNTEQFYMRDQYSSGPSLIYRNPSNNRLSIWRDRGDCTKSASHAANRSNCWYVLPHGNSNAYYDNNPSGDEDAVNLSYQELWRDYKTNYIAKYLDAADVYGWSYNTWDRQFYQFIEPGEKDDRMTAICDAAKEQQVVIFTIGFEVSDDDAVTMENCASSESHFFRVAGSELTTAFAEIANKISQLRLVD